MVPLACSKMFRLLAAPPLVLMALFTLISPPNTVTGPAMEVALLIVTTPVLVALPIERPVTPV
ncbi:hypothetical protein MCEGEM3_01985 [Oxalobacteraceae bacterium]